MSNSVELSEMQRNPQNENLLEIISEVYNLMCNIDILIDIKQVGIEPIGD